MSKGRAALVMLVVAAAIAALLFLGDDTDHDTTVGSTDSPSSTVLPPESSSTPSAAPEVLVPGEQVMIAAAETMFGWAPSTDTSPADAYSRATPYLAAAIAVPDPGTARADTGPGVGWHEMQRAGAYVQPRVSIAADEHPADIPTQVSRVVRIELWRVSATGDVAAAPFTLHTAWMTAAVDRDGTWKVSAVRIS